MSAFDPEGNFPGMLGDLFNLLGQQDPSNLWIEAARTLAVNVTTAGADEGSVDPVERIALEGLVAIAVQRLDDVTDGALAGGVPTVRALRRSEFALTTLEAWSPRIAAMVAARPELGGGEPGAQPIEMERIVQQMLHSVGPIFLGMQAGSAAGHLGREALALHHLALPAHATDEVAVVVANVAAFASDWSLDPDSVRLLALVRERAAVQLLSLPHVVERLEELLVLATEAAGSALSGFLGELEAGELDVAALLGNPEQALESIATPRQRWIAEQLSTAVAVLEAAVDRFTVVSVERLVGPGAPILEAYRRASTTYGQGAEGAAALFGIDRSQDAIDRAQRFVRGVEDRAGFSGLLHLARRSDGLPTPAEVDAPGLWLERLDLSAP